MSPQRHPAETQFPFSGPDQSEFHPSQTWLITSAVLPSSAVRMVKGDRSPAILASHRISYTVMLEKDD
jgi:hypothetical protein